MRRADRQSDSRLLAAAAAGDSHAFERLVVPHHVAVHRDVARRIGVVDAEDAAVTFIPRRIEVAVGQVDVQRRKCVPESPVQRQLWRIDSQQLERNGYELNGKQVDRDELPPQRALDVE
jgi:hypothetical protein